MLKKRISKIIMIALSVTMLYNYSGFSVKAIAIMGGAIADGIGAFTYSRRGFH